MIRVNTVVFNLSLYVHENYKVKINIAVDLNWDEYEYILRIP